MSEMNDVGYHQKIYVYTFACILNINFLCHSISDTIFTGGTECDRVELRIYNVGMKKKEVEEFPLMRSPHQLGKENVSSEAYEAVRVACNKYMVKFVGKDVFHLRVSAHLFHVLRLTS